ncbi:MAG TPA: methyltransferase [Acidimicrobiales bacterium]|nr:methyltransferase [Acidimicrobiales bacterium]
MSEFELEVERPALGGGVAHAPDGRVAFVRHALVGERVRVRVLDEAARFVRAEAVAVVRAAAGRVAPPCPHAGAGRCGGCDLQHADEATERAWKEAVVAEQLARIGGIDWSGTLRPAPSPAAGSRTRLRCAVDPAGRLGLRRSRSHDVEVLDRCWLADPRLAAAFARRWPGAREVELRALGEGEPVAVLDTLDGTRRAVGLDGRGARDGVARVSVGGYDYRVSPGSFWQSHRDAPALLVEAVEAAAALGAGERVVDLYAGVGLFSRPLADAVGPRGRVDVVEVSSSAVADARANVADAPWVGVHEAPVDPAGVAGGVEAGSVVVCDPPRTGLGRGVADALARARPRRVVYVSCDAATLARDLRRLLDQGFALVSLDAYDLFPKTEHVELVASLDAVAAGVDSAGGARRSRTS